MVLMGAPRAWAYRLLSWVVRHAQGRSRAWAEALLRELDFVPGEWTALAWALGGTLAVARHAGRWMLVERFRKIWEWKERAMEQMGKKAGWLVLGAVGTVALSLVALGVQFGAAALFPSLGLRDSMWTHLVMVLIIPLAICLGFAVKIWNTKRPVALGILLSAVVMSSHVILHFALR
jgi:hypothetical protein